MVPNMKDMKKLLLFWIFLSVLFVFAACSDSNDDAGSGNVAIGIPEITATTTGSLTVTSSVSGNTSQIVKKGFCYSVNTQNPTIKDNVVDANFRLDAQYLLLYPCIRLW